MFSYKDLLSEYEEAKQCVDDAELKIKRFTGRDADQYAVTYDGDIKLKSEGRFSGRGRGFVTRKRKLAVRNSARVDEVSPDESPYEDDDNPVKRKVQSTIVATGRQAKTRKELIRDQNCDSRGLARNRRMFGFVLGTLRKFEREEDQRVHEKKKREEIDKKLEEAAERDKEKMKEEKEHLFLMRKEQKIKMRCLEKKMEILERHEVWEKSQKHFKNFLMTDTKPSIMFLPAKHNKTTFKMLEEARERRTNSINARQAKVKRELAEIDYWYTRDNDDKKDEDEEDKTNEDEVDKSISDRDSQDMEEQSVSETNESHVSDAKQDLEMEEDELKEQNDGLVEMTVDMEEISKVKGDMNVENDSLNNSDNDDVFTAAQSTEFNLTGREELFQPLYD